MPSYCGAHEDMCSHARPYRYNLKEEKNRCGANSKNHNREEGKSVIEIGQVFGRLTVVASEQPRGRQETWRCRCICGGEKVVRAVHLRQGSIKSCGCLRREKRIALEVEPGQVFGRLTVIAAERRDNYETSWRCRCICGGEAVVRESSLRSGNTKSCGCLHRETQIAFHKRQIEHHQRCLKELQEDEPINSKKKETP